MAKRVNLKGIELNRTVGVEVEGYTSDFRNMRNNGIRHSTMKYDGSLTSGRYGVQGIEVVTEPLKQLDMLDDVFDDICKYQWNVGRGTAGTHIHVDSRDFYLEDKIKMAIFMQLIEKAMFLLVKKYRYSRRSYGRNQYCQPISNGWKRVLQELNKNYADISWKSFKKLGNLRYELSNLNRDYFSTPNTTRYQFVNIWSSSHDTIEFRIFHAMRSAKEAKMFALLAYSLVEMVKNSTLEQLEYIADVIVNKSTDSKDMVNKLVQSVGLDLNFKIQNKELAQRIDRDKRVVANTGFVAI